MFIGNPSILLLCVVCVVVYGVIGPRLFRSAEPEKIIRAKHLLFYLFNGMVLRVVWTSVFYRASFAWEIAGTVIGGCGLLLFQWAYRQHGAQTPGRAFTPSVPKVLITTGPYSRVRHPVYAAYLLSFLGMIVGTQDAVLLPAWLLMLALYMRAARIEERLFAGSVHAPLFQVYQQQSGLLVPWNVWRARKL